MIYSKKSHIGPLGRHNISISAAAAELLRQTKKDGAACGKERKNATRLFLPILVPLEDVPAKQIELYQNFSDLSARTCEQSDVAMFPRHLSFELPLDQIPTRN
ncbi:hypothetical protein DdX_17180 [Ditylenchus destructor]|uniref:Uncharacterized protein n=1 Tax=Ditylenchus destructor TaxID=166010 RepID=A0AAD4MPH1_9BILA|nr:hypothetical protein DdX_17180 [Ditylenchus destructor]